MKMINFSQTTLYGILCILIPCAIFLFTRDRRAGNIYKFWTVVFILYLWMVYEVTGIGTLSEILYPLQTGAHWSLFRGNINLVPFSGINFSFLLNILMCMPLGFLAPFLWKNWRRLYRTLLLGAGFSLLIEISQLFNSRASDVDDLIANTCGAVLGYAAWKVFTWIFSVRLKQPGKGRFQAVLYILLSFAGMFFFYHPFAF